MKKQELFEIISHYLPYSLNLYKYTKYKEDIGTSQEFEIVEMDDIIDLELVLENDSPHYDIKPILRSLSDLQDFDKKGLNENDKAEIFNLSLNLRFSSIQKIDPRYISMFTYLWLLKNHFDVFGLIEQGLAMDINTLKKINI